MRNVAIAERRWAAPSSAIRPCGPSARPSARSVGMPATRSSSRDCRVVIARQRRRRALRGGQPDQDHENRDERQRDQHDDGRLQVVAAMTATAAGVRIAAMNRAGRYAVKYGRNPSSPRTTTVAASSRRCASTRGAAAVTERSTAPPRSAIVAPAPRWPSRACSQVTAARIGPQRQQNQQRSPSSGPGARVAGSVITPATRWASTIAAAMAQALITTPQHTVGDQEAAGGRRCPPQPWVERAAPGAGQDTRPTGRSVPGSDRPRCVAGTPNTSTPGSRSPAARRSARPTS